MEIDSHGAYLKTLSLSNREILMPSPDGNQTHGGCALLVPYANRVRNAAYSWKGKEYHLPKNDGANSIHGLTKDMNWESSVKGTEIELSTVIEDEGYPSILKCNVIYRLNDASLEVDMLFMNAGGEGVPLSVGMHPYFNHAGNWSIEPASTMKMLNYADSYFPDGTSKGINPPIISSEDQREYDNCFLVGSSVKLTAKDYEMKIATSNMDYFVVYNGKYANRQSVAVEPMTSAPDAFNNRIGLVTLEPSKTFSCSAKFSIFPLSP